MESITFQCPNCGSYLRFDGETQKWVCDYCDSKFAEHELEQKGGGKKEIDYEVKKSSDFIPNAESTVFNFNENIEKSREENAHMQGYRCPSCGAEVLTDETTAATFCVFCQNPTILPEKLSGSYKPSRILPFQTTKEDAKEAFLQFCKGKPLLPKGFTGEARVEKITGIYVPYWVFNCHADFTYHSTGENIFTWSDGDYNYTKTDLYRIFRQGHVDFEDIPVDASEKMNDEMMDALEPYHLGETKDFTMSYLSGFLAEKYTFEPKELFDRMTHRVEMGIENAARNTASYQHVHSGDCQNQFRSEKQSYMLLPVWMLVSVYHNEKYLFAMNGQTGKIVGKLPYSKSKAIFWFIGIFIVTFLIVFIIGGLL